MGQAIGAAAGGAASAGGGSFLGTLFGAGGGFSSFLAGPGPGMILQIGLSLLARRKRKKEEERRIREGIEITGSPSIDFAPIVLGRRQVEQGVVVLKGNVVVNAGGRGWFQYTEVQAWAAAGRGGIGGIKSVWLDEDEYVVDAGNGIGGTGSDFVLYDPSSVPNAPTAPRNQWRYAIVEFPTYGESGKSEWANNRKWGYRSGAGAAANEAPGFELTVYDGSQTAADPGLVAKGSELHDWDRDFIGRNFAYTVMVFTRHGQNLSLWDKRGFPKIRVVLEGDKVPLTKAVQNTPASWTFSRNPAYLATYAHFELPVGTSIDANTPIDWTRVAAAATTADQTLTIPAGTIKGVAQSNTTEKRYSADVVVQGSATPAEIISQLELACDGDYLKVDGSWALDIPTSEADSGIELVDEMLASRATLIAGENLSSRFTSIAAAYIAPNENWKRVFTPEYESSTLLSKEGRALPRQDIALDAVTSPTQAWRLLLRQAYREEMQEQISIEGFHDLLRIRRGVNFKYKSDNLGISSFKRFVAENVSTESGSSPVVIVAREEDRARVYADPAIDDYPVYTDDQLVLPDTPPFPVQAMTARGVSGGIQLAITMPDIPGRIEIYDSPTSAWADASLKLVTTDSLVHIDYDAGTTRWFWARNNIGGEVSTRFPNDDVSTITATVPLPGHVSAARIVKAVLGDAPPDDEWQENVLWISPSDGRQWRGEPDPWVSFQQPGTYVASTKTVTFDNDNQNIVLGSDVSWTTAGGSVPSYGLFNTLLAVRGTANVMVQRDWVLMSKQSGIGSFLGSSTLYGMLVQEPMDDLLFKEGVENAVFNSVDVDIRPPIAGQPVDFRSVTIVFRDDVVGNYAVGPSLKDRSSGYWLVVRIGGTVYQVHFGTGSVRTEPYRIQQQSRTPFMAAMRDLDAKARAGTALPDVAVALITDPGRHADPRNYADAFTLESKQQQTDFVTEITGTDELSPFVFPAQGDVPDFIDGTMQVLQLDKTNRNWLVSGINRWVTIPDVAEEIIYTAVAERPLLPEQLPVDSWLYLEIADAPVDLAGATYADNLADAGFSSAKEYAYRAARKLPVANNPWQVEFWSHWGQGAPVSAVSRKQYGVRAPIRGNDGAWAFFDKDGNNAQEDWAKIRAATRLDLSLYDREGWRVLELDLVQEGDLITLEPTDNQFASFRVTAAPTDITEGKRFMVAATERYADANSEDVTGFVNVYFPMMPEPRPPEVQKFLYNNYGIALDGINVDGEYQFKTGGTNIGFFPTSSFKEIVNKATNVVLSENDAGENAIKFGTLELFKEPSLTFSLDRDGAWAAWKITAVGPLVQGQGYQLTLGKLLAYRNLLPDYSARNDDVLIGLSDSVEVSSSQLSVRILPKGSVSVGPPTTELLFEAFGKALEGPGTPFAGASVLFNSETLHDPKTNAPFRVDSMDVTKNGGKLLVHLPETLTANKAVTVDLTFTYGQGEATDRENFVLLGEPEFTVILTPIPPVVQRAKADGEYTQVRLGYSVSRNFGPLSYHWEELYEDGSWGEVSDRSYKDYARNERFGILQVAAPYSTDDPVRRWEVRLTCSTVDGEHSATSNTVIIEVVQPAGASGNSGPSGAQDSTPTVPDPAVELFVGETNRLAYDAGSGFAYSLSGDAAELQYSTESPPLITGKSEGVAYLRAMRSNTQVDLVPVVVTAPEASDRYGITLDAPAKAIPAGSSPVRISTGASGFLAYQGSTGYEHSITGSARLSEFADGENAKPLASNLPGAYIVVPDSVDADEDVVLTARVSQPGNFAVATRNLKITVLDYPNPPTALTVTFVTSSGFTLGWTAAAMATGKAPPTGYRVKAINKGTGFVAAEHTTTGTSQEITGLDASTTYTVEVTTDSDSDFSRTSLTGEQTTSSVTGTGTLPVPLSPTDLVFSSISNTAMTLSWTAPVSSSTRAAVTGYVVETRSGSFIAPLVSTRTTTSTTISLTGLTALTYYYFRVYANSAAGRSAPLEGVRPTLSALAAAGPSTALSVSNISRTGFDLSWTPPTAGGVLYYRVRYGTDSAFGQGTFTETRRSVANISVSGLKAETLYYLSVVSVSVSGESAALTGSTSTLDALVPAAPTNLVVSAISQTGMTVGWDAPAAANDRASPTSYRLRLRTGSSTGTLVDTYSVSGTSQALTGLVSGTTYYISVEANSTAGYGAALTGSQATLAQAVTLFAWIAGVSTINEGTRTTFVASHAGTAQGSPVYGWSVDTGTIVGSSTSSTLTVDTPRVSADTPMNVSLTLDVGEETTSARHRTTVKNVPSSFSASLTFSNYLAQYGTGGYFSSISGRTTGSLSLPDEWFSNPGTERSRRIDTTVVHGTLTGGTRDRIYLQFGLADITRNVLNVLPGWNVDASLSYVDLSGTTRTIPVIEDRTSLSDSISVQPWRGTGRRDVRLLAEIVRRRTTYPATLAYQFQRSAVGIDVVNVPNAPTALTISSAGTSGFTIGWTAPAADTNRRAVAGYRVVLRTGNEGGRAIQTFTPGASATSQAVTGLNTRTTYYISVEANSISGYSAALLGTGRTTGTLQVPLAPTSLSFSAVGDTGMTIGWTAPASASTRAAVTSYRLILRVGSASGAVARTVVTARTSAQIAQLVSGTTYYVSVEANSELGYGAALTGNRRTTGNAPVVPLAPTALTFSSVSDVGMTIGWTAPASSFMRAVVTGYRVRARTGGPTGNIVQSFTPGASATSQALTGLTAGTTYYISVEANSTSGYGPALTGNRTTSAAFTAPNAPTALMFSQVNARSMFVRWASPAVAVGKAPVTEYRLRVRTGSQTGTIVQTLTSGVHASQQLTGLTPTTAYYISVEANSRAGYSAALTGTQTTGALTSTPVTFSVDMERNYAYYWTYAGGTDARLPVGFQATSWQRVQAGRPWMSAGSPLAIALGGSRDYIGFENQTTRTWQLPSGKNLRVRIAAAGATTVSFDFTSVSGRASHVFYFTLNSTQRATLRTFMDNFSYDTTWTFTVSLVDA